MFDPYQNKVVHALLSLEERVHMKNLAMDRTNRIEVLKIKISGEPYWETSYFPFEEEKVYRIARVNVTMPSINWKHVGSLFDFMGTDENGESYLYEGRPKRMEDHWVPQGKFVRADWFSSFKEGTCHWYESLVERPDP